MPGSSPGHFKACGIRDSLAWLFFGFGLQVCIGGISRRLRVQGAQQLWQPWRKAHVAQPSAAPSPPQAWVSKHSIDCNTVSVLHDNGGSLMTMLIVVLLTSTSIIIIIIVIICSSQGIIVVLITIDSEVAITIRSLQTSFGNCTVLPLLGWTAS